MPDISFLIQLESVVAANGNVTLQHTVPRGEQLRITGWLKQSTGTFDVESLSDDAGRNYSNFNAGNPLASEFIGDVDNQNNKIVDFPMPITIEGGNSFNIAVLDTSGAQNTITIVLFGVRIIQ